MKWLIDEMFPDDVASMLRERGHDARSAVQDLRALPDEELFDIAITEGRVVLTENVADFVKLLQDRLAADEPVAPVVFALKPGLPRDPNRLARVLAERLDAWVADHPDPLPTAYWLPGGRQT